MRSQLTFLYDPTARHRTWDIRPPSGRLPKGMSILRRLRRVVARLLGRRRKDTPPVANP